MKSILFHHIILFLLLAETKYFAGIKSSPEVKFNRGQNKPMPISTKLKSVKFAFLLLIWVVYLFIFVFFYLFIYLFI